MVEVFVVAWMLLQQNGYKFKIIYRELEFMRLWELAAGSAVKLVPEELE